MKEWCSVEEKLPELNSTTDVWIDLGKRVTDHKWTSHDLQSPYSPHKITHWIKVSPPIRSNFCKDCGTKVYFIHESGLCHNCRKGIDVYENYNDPA